MNDDVKSLIFSDNDDVKAPFVHDNDDVKTPIVVDNTDTAAIDVKDGAFVFVLDRVLYAALGFFLLLSTFTSVYLVTKSVSCFVPQASTDTQSNYVSSHCQSTYIGTGTLQMALWFESAVMFVPFSLFYLINGKYIFSISEAIAQRYHDLLVPIEKKVMARARVKLNRLNNERKTMEDAIATEHPHEDPEADAKEAEFAAEHGPIPPYEEPVREWDDPYEYDNHLIDQTRSRLFAKAQKDIFIERTRDSEVWDETLNVIGYAEHEIQHNNQPIRMAYCLLTGPNDELLLFSIFFCTILQFIFFVVAALMWATPPLRLSDFQNGLSDDGDFVCANVSMRAADPSPQDFACTYSAVRFVRVIWCVNLVAVILLCCFSCVKLIMHDRKFADEGDEFFIKTAMEQSHHFLLLPKSEITYSLLSSIRNDRRKIRVAKELKRMAEMEASMAE